MKDIIYDFVMKGSFREPGVTCYLTALRDIVSYYNEDRFVSEIDLFFLVNGMNLKYSVNKYVGFDYEDRNSFSFFKENCTITSYNNSNKSEFLEILLRCLRSQEPVLCFVQSTSLDYHDVYCSNSNEIHAIIVYGLDRNEGVSYVWDNHIRLSYTQFDHYVGKLPISNLMEGILCSVSLRKQQYVYTSEDVLKGTINSIKCYLDDNSDNSATQYCGNRALQEFFKRSQDLSSIIDASTFFEGCQSISINMKINGPVSLNSYLYEICNRMEIPISERPPFFVLREAWIQLSNSILAAGIKNSRERFNKTISRAEQLLEEQNDSLNDLLIQLEKET